HFLAPYFEAFGAERVRVFLYDDLVTDPAALLSALFTHIGVEPFPLTEMTTRHAATGEIRGRARRALWVRTVGVRTALRPVLPRGIRDLGDILIRRDVVRPPLPAGLRPRLIEVLRPDILALEGLLQRDLGTWKR